MDLLFLLDKEAFLFINQSLSNSFFDTLAPILRNKTTWIFLYFFIVVFFLIKYRLKGLYLIGFILLTVGLADFISAGIIKPFFQRLRPCNDPNMIPFIHVRIPCGAGFSFVSSHACNHFAMAYFFIQTFRKKWSWIYPAAFIWALLISLSQIYVGVHYPLDVFIGALLGILISVLISQLRERVLSIE